jgi:deoxycytidine triphosphate deaminase
MQLEVFNFGGHDIILDSGMRVCQLIFEATIDAVFHRATCHCRS